MPDKTRPVTIPVRQSFDYFGGADLPEGYDPKIVSGAGGYDETKHNSKNNIVDALSNIDNEHDVQSALNMIAEYHNSFGADPKTNERAFVDSAMRLLQGAASVKNLKLPRDWEDYLNPAMPALNNIDPPPALAGKQSPSISQGPPSMQKKRLGGK